MLLPVRAFNVEIHGSPEIAFFKPSTYDQGQHGYPPPPQHYCRGALPPKLNIHRCVMYVHEGRHTYRQAYLYYMYYTRIYDPVSSGSLETSSPLSSITECSGY